MRLKLQMANVYKMSVIKTKAEYKMTEEIVYVVYHKRGEIWVLGNIFKDRNKAEKEAEYYNGYVLTRDIIK